MRFRRFFKEVGQNNKFVFGLVLFLVCFSVLISFIVIVYFQKPALVSVAGSIVSACGNSGSKEVCYIRQFDLFSKENSLKTTMSVLKAVQDVDSTTKFCHVIAHKISNNEVSKNPEKWLDLLSEIDIVSCNEGFFHGVIEGYMASDPQFLLDENSMMEICKQVGESLSPNSDMTYFNDCIHTSAHLLLVQEESDVERSLEVCHKMDEELKLECSYGVFMEDAQRLNLEIHGYKSRQQIGFEEAEFYKRECNEYEGKDQSACWLSRAWIFYSIGRLDTNKMFENCSGAEIKDAFMRCYSRGLAIIIAVDQTQKLNKVPINDYCSRIEEDGLYRECNKYLLDLLLRIGKSFNDYSREYCLVTKDEYKSVCSNLVEETIQKLEKRKGVGSVTEVNNL